MLRLKKVRKLGSVEISTYQPVPMLFQFKVVPRDGQEFWFTERLVGGKAALLLQVAFQPASGVEQSERNSTVMVPPEEFIVPGEFVPVYIPIRGALVELPS